ncbi:MAG: hypothetical protein FJY86_00830 [Candidatus Diapherotrites archaeon]|uniref:Class III signal peptide-containing protein n=1 Tax=Candidatus Iainarchaeum sp. TaxID=3101447 RepID=A0A8T4C7E9_9ARCH|nr:hypothetical protein [Candidatus Diapherotrites archaeon]
MHFGKRGQSALEYLMTYGWALVVIVIAVAALVVLIDPSKIQGNQCDPRFGQFTVSQSNLVAGTSQFALVNQTGHGVTLTAVNVSGTYAGSTAYNDTGSAITSGTTLNPNQTVTVIVDQDPDLTSGSYNLTYTFTYDAGQLTGLTAAGSCHGTI